MHTESVRDTENGKNGPKSMWQKRVNFPNSALFYIDLIPRLHHVLRANPPGERRGHDWLGAVAPLDGGPLRPGHHVQGPQADTQEGAGRSLGPLVDTQEGAGRSLGPLADTQEGAGRSPKSMLNWSLMKSSLKHTA